MRDRGNLASGAAEVRLKTLLPEHGPELDLELPGVKETGILGIAGSSGSRGAKGVTCVGEDHGLPFSHSQFQLAWTTPTHPAPKLEPIREAYSPP